MDQERHLDPEKMINWSEFSRYHTGKSRNIAPGKIPKKYRWRYNMMLYFIGKAMEFINQFDPENKK